MEPRVAKNWVDKRDYSSDSYIADGLASRGIPSYVSHATILSCHYLAPLSPNSEIVVRDKDLQAAFRALRDDRFLDCRTKRACEEEFSKGSGPKPDAVKSIYKLDKAIDNAKDNGIKRSYESKRADCIKDAWLWFVYLNAIVWLYRHNQDDPKRGHTLTWNQIMKEVDQELVLWLNNWKALYLVTDNRDKESHRAKFEKCIEDVTRALRPKRRK
ncbi:hypothetical protein APSETT444_001673 [Aspergillus pseudonomiae]